MQILIKRVGTEIHLAVPFEVKDRAKKVGGYRWNPALKVWVYPSTPAIFSELVAEFGDDAIVEGFDTNTGQASRSPTEPTIQDQLNEKIKSQERALQSQKAEIDQLREELNARSQALDSLQVSLNSKSTELEDLRKQVASLQTGASDEQRLKQSIEFWKHAASDAEKKYNALVKEVSQAKPCPPVPVSPVTTSDPFVNIVQRAIGLAGNERDFDITIKNTTLSRAALDLATAAEKKLRKAINVLSTDKRDFISVIREATEKRAISDEARGLLNFVRQNRNRVAHEQLSQPELWARSCIAILATSIVWPELRVTKTY